MGEFSLLHWILVLAVIVVLFGAGKMPDILGDLGKGIRAFREGMEHRDGKPDGGHGPKQP
ncbi:MAG: twin-arginine translocase TatA/TatE family subunit [Alphaproteobacteria bacterium]|nr:twin-arginine translocase TatA/TatE family subunit [Alphaproteobacteria bacterium]